MGRVDDIPLARLLALAFNWMIDELHERLRANGWDGVRPAFGFHLLALRDAPLTTTELAARLGVSKQAASKVADAMVAQGLVERTQHESDGRQWLLALAPRGHALLDEVEAIYAELEAEWAAVIGDTALGETRLRLATVLDAVHGGTLPPIRPAG